jgi:hypothetical protein
MNKVIHFKNGSEIKIIPTPEEMAIRSIRGRKQIEKMAKMSNSELQWFNDNIDDADKIANKIFKDITKIKDGVYSKLTKEQKKALKIMNTQ